MRLLRKPEKIYEAIQDDSCVEAMQESYLQFLGCKKYWILVVLPHGAKVDLNKIGSETKGKKEIVDYDGESRRNLQLVDGNFLDTEADFHAVQERKTIFWQTVTVITLDNGEQELKATIDTHEYTISESSVINKLKLADENGRIRADNVFETPKGKDSGEADISPSGLQAAEILVQVASQKTKDVTRKRLNLVSPILVLVKSESAKEKERKYLMNKPQLKDSKNNLEKRKLKLAELKESELTRGSWKLTWKSLNFKD
ncbi:hypothetical protein Tco_0723859 [Tanacetum coccineum]